MLRTSLILMFCTVLCCSLRVGHRQETMTGGWSSVEVGSADKEIDEFIRSEFPNLKSAELVGVSQQVVAGMNYKYSYKLGEDTFSVTVWDQPWLKHRQVTAVEKVEVRTRPDDEKVQVTTNTRIETRPFSQVAREAMQ